MKNVKIGYRLIIGFVLIALATVNLGWIGYSGLNDTKLALEKTSNQYLPGVESLARLRYNVNGVMAAQRTLLLPSLSKKDREAQYEIIAKFREGYAEAIKVYEAIPHSSEVAKTFENLKSAIAEAKIDNDRIFSWIKEWEQNKANEELVVQATQLALGKAQQSSNAMFDIMDKAIAVTKKESDTARNTADVEASKDTRMMVMFMIATPILALLAGVYLTFSILAPMRKGVAFATAVAEGQLDMDLDVHQRDEIGQLADKLRVMVDNLKVKIAEAEEKSVQASEQAEKARLATLEAEEACNRAERARAEGMLQAAGQLEGVVEIATSASEQLSAQIEQSSRGAEEQSNQVSETATAMEEMNATVLEVAKNASRAAETSDNAKAKAQQGQALVEKVVAGIGQVQRQSLALKQDMEGLGRQAQDIGQIMNVISDIADQTNLLALNAAIEAARAGEAGRGFAVVADEVRKLAEKTMTATKEVGEAIRGIQDGTKTNMDNVDRAVKTIEDATELASKSGESLGEIVGLVDEASDQVRSIATASEEQSSASEEINRSIEQVATISAQTAQTMGQAAQAVSELARQTQVLQNLITDMKAEAGDDAGPVPARRAPAGRRAMLS
jgi:methyl-accepting chemotaxis protein